MHRYRYQYWLSGICTDTKFEYSSRTQKILTDTNESRQQCGNIFRWMRARASKKPSRRQIMLSKTVYKRDQIYHLQHNKLIQNFWNPSTTQTIKSSLAAPAKSTNFAAEAAESGENVQRQPVYRPGWAAAVWGRWSGSPVSSLPTGAKVWGSQPTP